MKVISEFKNEHRFLSNFYIAPLTWDGIIYPSSEHAYVAAKTLNINERIKISKLTTPGQAKRYGRNIQLRPQWDELKVDIMYDILTIKFQSPELSAMLIATGDHRLVETNTWGDTIWGVCDGEGENLLGKLLMKVRDDLLNNQRILCNCA